MDIWIPGGGGFRGVDPFQEHGLSGSDMDRLHAAAATGHIVSSCVLLVVSLVSSRWSAPLVATVLKRNDTDVTIITVADVDVVWLLVAAGFVSGIHHAFFSHVDGARWADYAVSSPLMVFAIGTLSGVADVWTLTSMSVLQSVLMASSGILEHESRRKTLGTGNVVSAFAVLSITYGVGVWGPIFAAFDEQGPPSWVVVIVVVIFFWFLSFGIVFFLEVVELISEWSAEKAYVLLSLSAKLQLQWTLYGGTTSASGSQTVWVSVVSAVVFVGTTAAAILLRNVAPPEKGEPLM